MAHDGSMVLKLALFGGAAYLAYRYFFSGTTTTAVTLPTVSTMPATSGSTVTLTGSATSALTGKTLDQVYQNMVAAASAAKVSSGTADDWNWYLMISNPGFTAPDPAPLFSAANSSWQRGDQLSAAQYWTVMGPTLKAQYGLSGLGFYASAFQGVRPKGGLRVRS